MEAQKKKEVKDIKNETTLGISWIKGKPTEELLHNCLVETHKKMEQLHKRKPKPSIKVFEKIYAKILGKHAKIIDKNMGISYMNFKFNLEDKPIYKEGIIKTK